MITAIVSNRLHIPLTFNRIFAFAEFIVLPSIHEQR